MADRLQVRMSYGYHVSFCVSSCCQPAIPCTVECIFSSCSRPGYPCHYCPARFVLMRGSSAFFYLRFHCCPEISLPGSIDSSLWETNPYPIQSLQQGLLCFCRQLHDIIIRGWYLPDLGVDICYDDSYSCYITSYQFGI